MPYWYDSISDGDVTATRMTAEVKNADSVTLVRGDVVYLFGATGNRASVKLASNAGEATSSKSFGIVEDTIAPNNTGNIVTHGVIDGINLGAYDEGDQLYLAATAGDFTKVTPVAPAHTVFIGVVERANAGNGQIYVKVQNGYELGELHNVLTNGAGDGNVLAYDSDTLLWTHRDPTQSLLFTGSSAETVNRVIGAASSDTPATGTAALTMFRAEKTITVGNVSMITGASTSSGLTLARIGLYTIDGSGNATLVARTASDTTLFNSSTTLYTRAFATAGGYPATYKIHQGSLYAIGVICVGSSGGNYQSTLILSASTVIGDLMGLSPRLAGNLNSQTDLPTSIASGSFVRRGRLHYGRFTA
jgi:hypothetical protein